jgi:hypothetical protein
MKSTHHAAVIVAAAVFFAIGAGWYTVLADPWMAGIGKTMEQLAKDGARSPVPMVVGFAAILVMCYTLDALLNRLGTTGAASGAMTAALVALGLVAANLALNYGFEMRGVGLWLINSGYALVGLVVAGAIIGGWRGKAGRERRSR